MTVVNKITKFLNQSYQHLTTTNTKEWCVRRFRFYLILGDVQDDGFPWLKTAWSNDYEPLLSQLLQKSPEFKNTGIRVLEYKKASGVPNYYSVLKLGRLKWDTKSHHKWTVDDNIDIKFNQFESWTPIWTICDRTSSAPDIFILIQNQQDSKQRFSPLQFNVFVVIAVAEDLNVDCDSIVIDFSKRINAKRAIAHSRLWSTGKKDKEDNWTFLNWIQDTHSNGIYKGQSPHNFKYEDIVFEPYWETIYRRE